MSSETNDFQMCFFFLFRKEKNEIHEWKFFFDFFLVTDQRDGVFILIPHPTFMAAMA